MNMHKYLERRARDDDDGVDNSAVPLQLKTQTQFRTQNSRLHSLSALASRSQSLLLLPNMLYWIALLKAGRGRGRDRVRGKSSRNGNTHAKRRREYAWKESTHTQSARMTTTTLVNAKRQFTTANVIVNVNGE